ncbi:hypothetical protein JCM24511_05745 [Saitozyma sp. JCM 24511]|nr:hypothetical protein JCM24511_05745 [Saitozyma sp. JCM 24511]
MRIALAQTSPISAPSGPAALEKPHSSSPFPTLDENLVGAVKAVEHAVAQKADIVVFPEYFLQGIANESRQYLTFPAAHLLAFIQSLAKRYNVAIVGSIVHGALPLSAEGQSFPASSPFAHIPLSCTGSPRPTKITPSQLEWAKFIEQNLPTTEENSEPVLKNTAFYVEAGTGELKGDYVKRNLWHPERDYLTAGEEEHQVFETKWGKAGLLICWDMSHPAAAQALADLGVDIIFAPTYWLATDSEPLIHNHPHQHNYETEVVSALCMVRSFETETVFVMCNAGGDEIEGFMGGSGVWAPLRGCVAKMGAAEGVQVVEVDPAVLKDGRKTYKIREDWSRREAS